MKTVIVALALTVFLCGCSSDSKQVANKKAEPEAQTVEVVPVASQKLATVFTLPAQLVPFQTVDIYPKVTGFMDVIRVDRGSRVRKGELIIRLSAPELVAQRAQAESALRAAQSQLTTVQAKLTVRQRYLSAHGFSGPDPWCCCGERCDGGEPDCYR